MASTMVSEIRAKSDGALAKLTRRLQGIEPYMERADAPGEWTTRQVLSHLLAEAGRDPVATLKRFSERDFPTLDLSIGKTSVAGDRATMTPKQFLDALDRQRQGVLRYLEGLSDAELTQRKARIPIFKQFMGTEDIPLHMYATAVLDLHLNQHGDQLAKIRKAVGLPEA